MKNYEKLGHWLLALVSSRIQVEEKVLTNMKIWGKKKAMKHENAILGSILHAGSLCPTRKSSGNLQV